MVYVQFIVEKDANVRECKVLRGIEPECDAEAMSAVSSLKGWLAGRHRGRPVDVRYVVLQSHSNWAGRDQLAPARRARKSTLRQ